MYVAISRRSETPGAHFHSRCRLRHLNPEMLSSPQPSHPEHPLLADRDRLDAILDIMYAKIQKTLFPGHPGWSRPRAETGRSSNAHHRERILEGTGVSADDVLSEAFLGLLEYSPERLEGTWEGLAVRIARNKAVDALRAATRGLRGTEYSAPTAPSVGRCSKGKAQTVSG